VHTLEVFAGQAYYYIEMTAQSAKKRERPSPVRWLYGLNPVLEALRSGRAVRAVYIYSGRRRHAARLVEEAGARDVPIKVIYDRGFFDSRFPKGHQGVAAEAGKAPSVSIDELMAVPGLRGEEPFFLVLDLIEDPRNLGAILRSAEAAGVHGVVVQERHAAGLGPEARKASAGASEHMPLCVVTNVKHAIHEMKQAGMAVAGAEAGPHPPPWDLDLRGPLALVIGSEGKGLRRTVREKCDFLTSLPMRGRVGSLNASVSAGVLLYEALRQRSKNQGVTHP
jgi:23S rRNA (guanosine2251-2'-O)-methyltransferase